MQDKLVRCISNLQGDAEASIRTNATVFLGKIAFRLKEGVRNRVLCAAFSKAMRDNFVPCRISGLKAATTCITVLDHAQLVSKVLPAACILIMDRSGEVRELAFAFIEQSVRILRENHEKQLRADRENAEKQTGNNSPQKGVQPQSGGWTSWAVDGISKTIEKVTIDGTAPVNTSTTNNSYNNSNTSNHATSNTNCQATTNTNPNTNIYKTEEKRIDANDAWGDDDVDWGDDDDGDMNNKNLPKQKSSSTINTTDDWGGNGGWDDDEIIDEDDNKPEIKPAGYKVASSFNNSVSVNKSDPFAMMEKKESIPHKPIIGGLTVSSKNKDKKKVAITKLAVSSSDNWDDF